VEDRFSDVTNAELLDEIARRSECFLLAWVPNGNQKTPGVASVYSTHCGGLLHALGLHRFLGQYLDEEMADSEDAESDR
jgi:hypothetical protein